MVKQTSFIAAVLLLSLCLPLAAREIPIGTHGATLSLSESWQRQTLIKDLGPDQFLHEDGYYAAVVENLALLERRADFEAELEVPFANLERRFEEVDVDPEIQYRRDGRIGHCTRQLQGSLQGLRVAYRIDLLSRDGLGYMVISWTGGSKAAELEVAVGELVTGIAFPDPQSEWGRKAEPASRSFRFDDWVIEVSYRESVFPHREDDGERSTLTSTEGTAAIHLFLDVYDDNDLESALDDIVDLLSEDSEIEELERIDLDLEAGSARQALLRQGGDVDPYDLAVVMVEVADNTYVDLRLVSSGKAGHREQLWNEVLDSLRVTPPVQVDAFPVVEQDEGEPESLNRAALELLSNATRLDSEGSSFFDAVPAGDSSVIVLGSRQVSRVAEGAAPDVLYRSDAWIAGRRVVVADQDVLLVSGDQRVSRIVDRELRPADFEARFAASTGTGLVLVRDHPAPAMLGFDELTHPDASRLIDRDASGEERTIVELEGLTVSAMAGGRGGSAVLLAVRKRQLLEDPDLAAGVELVEIDLATAKRQDLGAWSRIDNLERADGGWLVSGAPANELMGVY